MNKIICGVNAFACGLNISVYCTDSSVLSLIFAVVCGAIAAYFLIEIWQESSK